MPEGIQEAALAAFTAEEESVERGIDAWKKVVAANRGAWLPRRELARLYRAEGRWKALVEVLGEAVDKATWEAPADKVVVLLDMVDVYRDELKLDLMVVNTLNKALAIDPTDLSVLDALIDQYQHMKRWPDVVNNLRKKVDLLASDADKVAVHLQVAEIYLERFSNQAEAIKAYEKVRELEPGHTAALDYLKSMYEKRRDWAKLIAIHQSEVELVEDPAAKLEGRLTIARLGAERLKRPAVCIELWQAVLADDPQQPEALAALEKLYERQKSWPEMADILVRLIENADSDATREALYTKLALLQNDKLKQEEAAVDSWKALLEVNPDNRRAQDALRKMYLARKDWDALEQFYANQGKWDEYVRLLERQADQESGEAQVALWLKVGGLYRDTLEKPDRAQRAFERVLSLDAENLAAAEALMPQYEAANDATKLVNVLGIKRNKLSPDTDKAERTALAERMVGLLENDVKDVGAAAGLCLDVFSEAPDATWTADGVERLAGAAGLWAELATAFESHLQTLKAEKASDGADKGRYLKTLAGVYERELADVDKAIANNKAVLELDADDEDAIAALERLYTATEQHDALVDVFTRKLALAETPAAKGAARLRLAGLYLEQLGDHAKAIALFEENLQADPEDAGTLAALDRLYTETEDHKSLADVIKRQLALPSADDTDKAAKAALMVRLGRLQADKLGAPAEAVDNFKAALAIAPGNAEAQGALEAFLDDADHRRVAVDALEPLYEERHDIEKLVKVHRIRLELEENPTAKVALLLRIGELENQLARPEAAYEAYAQAFTLEPSTEDAHQALESLAEALGRWPDLVGRYETVLKDEGLHASLRRSVLLASADIYDKRLGQADKAVAALEQANALAPANPDALEALERIFVRQEQWRELVGVLKKKADIQDAPEAREAMLVQVANVYDDTLSDPLEAILAWSEVLEHNAGSKEAHQALARLYAGQEMYAELSDNLEKQLDLAEAEGDALETQALLVRLGTVQLANLGEPAAAIESYRRLLSINADHPQAIEALEGLLPEAAHEETVAGLLEPVYRRSGASAALVRVLEIRLAHTEGTAERIGLFHEIATVHEEGTGDLALAYEAVSGALGEDPLAERTLSRAEKLARDLSCVDTLIARLAACETGLDKDEDKNALFHRMAELASRDLGDDAQAIKAYKRALETDAKDLAAAEALEDIYTRLNDHEALVALYLQKADMVEDAADRKTLRLRAATAYEEILDDADKAIAVCRTMLEETPSDGDALDNLERLFVRLSRWSDLKDIYATKAELATDPQERKNMLTVLAQMYDRDLADKPRAIDTYKSILDMDADDMETLQALDRLYADTEAWYDLLGVLERQVELTEGAESIAVKHRIGDLWRRQLKDHQRATEAFSQVLQVAPTHPETIAALEEMMSSGEEPVLAAQVLEPVFEAHEAWPQVLATYEVMAANTEEDSARATWLTKVAETAELRLADPDKAFDAYRRILATAPTDETVLENLDRLALVSDRWGTLRTPSKPTSSASTTGTTVWKPWLRIARIREEHTEEFELAIRAYQKVADVEPDRTEGLEALDRLYTRLEKWPDLVNVLRREIRLADSNDSTAKLTFRLAQVLELQLEDLPKAVEAYREVLQVDPGHEDTLQSLEGLIRAGKMQQEIAQILEPIYVSSENWSKLVALFEIELERVTERAERLEMLRRLASTSEERLSEPVAAFDWWCQILLTDPGDTEAMEELLRLARTTNNWDRYVETMTDAAGMTDDEPARANVLVHLAATYETDLVDLERAELVLRQILEATPDHGEALEMLDRILDAKGEYEALATVLRQRIALTGADDELRPLHLRLGAISSDVLQDTEGAIASFEAVLESDPHATEALDALERLFFRTERWKELFAVYERRLNIAPSTDEEADCYARMGLLHWEAFEDRDNAIACWTRVVDLKDNDPTALLALADLHEAAEEWDAFTGVLERQLATSEDDGHRVAALKRLGQVFGEKLARPEEALSAWNQILDIAPTDVDALKAVAAHHRGAENWAALAATLRRLINESAAPGADAHFGFDGVRGSTRNSVALKAPIWTTRKRLRRPGGMCWPWIQWTWRLLGPWSPCTSRPANGKPALKPCASGPGQWPNPRFRSRS